MISSSMIDRLNPPVFLGLHFWTGEDEYRPAQLQDHAHRAAHEPAQKQRKDDWGRIEETFKDLPYAVLRIRMVPGSRIQKQQQKRGVKKKNFCHTFLCSHKFHKIENYFSFEVLKKKIWANFLRIIELFTPKNCH